MGVGLGLREWGPAEYRAGVLGALGLTARVTHEAAIARWFADNFGAPALVLNSGSSALQLALQLLAEQRPGRHEVVIPALACPALTRVVGASGLEPVYADISSNLNTSTDALKGCLGPQTLAVIMVHAYGHPADSAGILALCRQSSVALIDDAAQRVDPTSGLGTAGDFGIFSFAQSKSVVCGIDGSGGVLLVNARQHLPALEQRWAKLPVAPRRHWAWLEFALSPHFARTVYYVSRWRRRNQGVQMSPARIAGVDAAIALPQLASLDARRQRRLQLLQQYHTALREFGIQAPQMTLTASPDYLTRLMVRVVPQQRQQCRAALAALGIASRLPYRLPTGMDTSAFPQATHSAAELLELPLPSKWSAQDIALVARTVAPFRLPARDRPIIPPGALACNTTGN